VGKADVPGGTMYEPAELVPNSEEVGIAPMLELDGMAVLSEGTAYSLDEGPGEVLPDGSEVGTASVLELVWKTEVPDGTTYDGPTELVPDGKDVSTASVFEAEVPEGTM
jgi:hypothetical protein